MRFMYMAIALCVLAAAGTGICLADEEYNLLPNGNFELDEDGDNFPDGWHYTWNGGCIDLSSEAKEGRKSLHLEINPEYGKKDGSTSVACASIDLWLKHKTKYKRSAWVKAKLGPGAVCGHIGGKFTKSTDWQYVESTFETPDKGKKGPPERGLYYCGFAPASLSGPGEVWVDDARLVDCGPVDLGSVVLLRMDNTKGWSLSAHENEEPVPAKTRLSRSRKVTYNGSPCLQLPYYFSTDKHDAVMMSRKVDIESADTLALTVFGDGSGHELFAVLVDGSSESHCLTIGPVYWKGWKTVYASLLGLCVKPGPNTITAYHWSGDNTQTLEFPIKGITIGLNDKPDSFKGKGDIYFGLLEFFK